eukprot:5618054-Pyramimonas_sp.AAC.1
MASLRPATLTKYQQAVADFEAWARRQRLPFDNPKDADSSMNLYIEHLFSSGSPQYMARNAPYGLARFRGWAVAKPHFARSKDALAGWLAKTPRRPGMPAPLDAVIACVGALAERSSLGALAA